MRSVCVCLCDVCVWGGGAIIRQKFSLIINTLLSLNEWDAMLTYPPIPNAPYYRKPLFGVYSVQLLNSLPGAYHSIDFVTAGELVHYKVNFMKLLPINEKTFSAKITVFVPAVTEVRTGREKNFIKRCLA